MDVLTIVVMIILFIVALIFVFSTALLTPYIGKKNLISVILLGLVVGVVGGTFLLSPIVGDLPDFTRTIVEESIEGTDTVKMELSTNGNLTQIIENISSISGVEKVDYDGIKVTITNESDMQTYGSSFIQALNNSDTSISNVEKVDNTTLFVRIAGNGDPQTVLNSIYSTFKTNSYMHLRYTSMEANATVTANNITKILAALRENDLVITEVTGPTEDTIQSINQYLPNETNVILVSGVLGVIVGLVGFFVDNIYNFVGRSRRRNKNKKSRREKIKRRTVPGSDRQRPNDRKRRPKRDSIDIFSEDFDESPKQTLGSNKQFEPLTKEEKDEKPKKESEKKSRFSNPFKRSSNDKSFTDKKSSPKTTKKESETEKKKSRKIPKVRPKRRE